MDYSKLYDYLMSVHSFFPYYFGRGKSFPPARVQLELTYRCNLKCSMCYQDKNLVLPSEELKTAEWRQLIEQLPKVCLITLIGGEPLIRNDFKEIVGAALPFQRFNMVSNGVYLSKEINKFLIGKRFLLLGVSIDGVGDVHDQIRGLKGIYDKVMVNLKNLQEQKIKYRSKNPFLDIKTVITSANQDNLCDLFDEAERLQADFFTISIPKVSVDQFNPKLKETVQKLDLFDFSLLEKIDFEKLKDTLKKITKRQSRVKIRFYPKLSSIEGLDKNLYNPKLINENFFPCRQPWSGVQITAYGDVYPCLSLKIGNIRENAFSEIWNGEKFVSFRRDLKKHRLFKDCLGCCYLKQR